MRYLAPFSALLLAACADHMGIGAPSSVDMVEVLGDWVERGKAPGDLVQATHELKPPFPVIAARPMCRYPAFPRYRGGDTSKAESFECARR